MKTLVKFFILFVTTTLFAQNTIEKEVGEFTELKVFDLIQVELKKSNENKAIISGENKEDVVIVNNEGKLKIKMKLDEAFDGAETKVVLYYTAIDIIDVNEGSKVASKDIIEQFEIDLKAQEGGIIEVPINVKYANVRAVTGGSVTTIGSSKKQNISLLTGGIYDGKSLKTQSTDVSISAAGEAYVNASKQVDAKVRAGGTIYIYGNPETINESKVLGGTITRM
ncbi:head GIN domain-containing protein [Flavisericum labens]|uniref:head GIN domain-containing protein n=1 Tax=Flavisericum labens TaxID=3377112 RepID=UPI00387B8CCF